MTAPARFHKADVKRAVSGALEAMEKAGIQVGSVIVGQEGRVVLTRASAVAGSPRLNPLDRILKDAP